jgi:hypothetical protein
MRATSLDDDRLPPARTAFATATLAGIVLGLLGPFGSYLNDGLLLRLLYWVGAMWLGLLLNGAGFLITRKWAAPLSWRHWVLLVGWVLAASVPEAFVTRSCALVLWPAHAQFLPGWTVWYGQVATISLLCVTCAALATRALTARTTANAIAAPGPATPPVEALARLRGHIMALQMEDHYVRVHTGNGSDLILMPLSRAIGSMTADGIRTHRSWWVARHAVERVEGTPRSMCLRLKNGVVAPVSRSAVASLRAAGWLQDDG